MRIPLSDIFARASERPEGYVEDVMSSGVVDGDDLVIMDDRMEELRRKYTEGPPGLIAQIGSVIKAAARWGLAGCPVVTAEQLEERLAACDGCERWDGGKVREGTGRCLECGCLSLKLHMTTEVCRLQPPKWPDLTAGDGQ